MPDGLQNELTPDYLSGVVRCASKMYALAKEAGKESELPKEMADMIVRMATAAIAITTPSMVQPRFNDCYTLPLKGIVMNALPFAPEREDFKWVVSNRAEGNPPKGETASRCMPWGGFAAMRSDWGPDATYLCFDYGPLGEAHVHQDKLTFTLWKGGEELIFEDGGGLYETSAARDYAISGYGHNTLLVDDLAQFRKRPLTLTAPVDCEWSTSEKRDRAVGVYDQGFGEKELKLATHRREIVFDKEADVFTITDTMESADGEDHDYTLLFQMETTNTTVSADGTRLIADYGGKWNLEIEVEGGKLTTAVGQLKPRLAGWFVGRNDKALHPATTAMVKVPRGKKRVSIERLRPVRSGR